MPQYNLDGLGWTYVAIVIAWNLALAAGMIFLWINRQLPSLRMRRVPLLLVGVFSLHIYGAICTIAYPFGSEVSCNLNFWMMSILLPFGIALFHAANSQFLHHASRQKQFATLASLKDHKPLDEKEAQEVASNRWKRISAGIERADNIDRTLFCIYVGMAVQLVLTIFVFFGSKKFHASYGLFEYTVRGTGMEVSLNCAKGWEWWLSIVWQLFWAWIYAPYLLWKSRSVRDVHGWRLQTICCCVAGLPASPLWLAGMYAPQMAVVNQYIPPPTWFSICVFFMEVFAIGFPIVDVLKGNKLRQETLDAIANWEKRQAANALDTAADGSLKSPGAFSITTTLKSTGDTTVYSKTSFESNKSDMLTMTALENALRTNALPLLEFAALKDFSGENVSFLTHVADWRRYWFSPKGSTAAHRRTQFIAAVRIYAQFISLEFSEFPINISSKEMKRLHTVFERAAVILNRSKRGSAVSAASDNATPFDSVQPDNLSADVPTDCSRSYNSESELHKGAINLDTLGRANLRAITRLQDVYMEELIADIEIPDQFTELVFDHAEREIKYLVLTNTWPKFVNVGYASSQVGQDVDPEKGNDWRSKVLCSK